MCGIYTISDSRILVVMIKNKNLRISNCNAHAVTPGDAEKIDRAIEGSIRDQTSQYLEIIKAKSGLTFEQIAIRVGKAPSYISSLYNQKKSPAFGLWKQSKSAAMDPVEEMSRLDPNLDIFEKKPSLVFSRPLSSR